MYFSRSGLIAPQDRGSSNLETDAKIASQEIASDV
jgi:hypothetical protein